MSKDAFVLLSSTLVEDGRLSWDQVRDSQYYTSKSATRIKLKVKADPDLPSFSQFQETVLQVNLARLRQ